MDKIVICGLLHDPNLGDPIIIASVRKLVEEAVPNLKEFQIELIDLYARAGIKIIWDKKPLNTLLKIPLICLGVLRRICAKFNQPLSRKIAYARWKLDPNCWKRLQRYFTYKMYGSVLAIVAGGGLIEYCSHEYYLQISVFIQSAEELGIPVVFNAVGIVGASVDQHDWRVKMMHTALNSPIVKRITVRDDVEMMNKAYLAYGKEALRTADPGVWIAEILGKIKSTDSDIIGLGLIRSDSFMNYGISLNEEQLISIWVDIVKELDRRNLKWKFFCNGFEKDYLLGLKILDSLGVSDTSSKLVERPTEYPELVDTISNFHAVICHRLHACIISYALDIPCVALSWNRKLTFFFEAINCPERVFENERFDAVRIVDAIIKADSDGYDPEIKRAYMEEARRSVEEAVKLVI